MENEWADTVAQTKAKPKNSNATMPKFCGFPPPFTSPYYFVDECFIYKFPYFIIVLTHMITCSIGPICSIR
ncbi:hypothetical protein K440DRAFT_614633 [Wilcoxina mikolae CBS 423.85]|nr:hypothetical protein K440DRAFT_614633 [Wilcoxina mikolae CBS 423.85]